MAYPWRQVRDGRWTKSIGIILYISAFGSLCLAKDPAPPTYALAAPPLEIYDHLWELKQGAVPVVSEAERKLLEKIWKLKNEKATTGDVPMDHALLLEA